MVRRLAPHSASASVAGWRSRLATTAPRVVKPCAMTRPMPPEPPVTTTRRGAVLILVHVLPPLTAIPALVAWD